jgi:hypothetical protein
MLSASAMSGSSSLCTGSLPKFSVAIRGTGGCTASCCFTDGGLCESDPMEPVVRFLDFPVLGLVVDIVEILIVVNRSDRLSDGVLGPYPPDE